MRGQIWIETVLYTLIGLTLIGVTLGFVMPKINETKDKALVDQAISSLSGLDDKINDVIVRGAGNVRQTELSMKKGEFYINSSGDGIMMVLRGLGNPYSEPGVEIAHGRIKILTVQGAKTSDVYLTMKYGANITYLGSEGIKKFDATSVPYLFNIENRGPLNGASWINIEENSNR